MAPTPPPLPAEGSDKGADAIKNLSRKRGVVKGRLTNFKKHVYSLAGVVLSVEQRAELKLRIQGINSLFSEFHRIQNDIDELVDESKLQEQLEARECFEIDYYAILAKAKCMTNDDERQPCAAGEGTMQSVKLPTITLPEFDGSYQQWLEFRDTFISLVHSSKSISTIQKFHYLKSSLKKDAQAVIESLEFSADSYIVAWELLLNRYNNSKLLVHNHLKSLFSMSSISKESSTLIRKVIDTTLKNLRALKQLGEPTEHWDTIIIFMVVSKLDQATEREWEQHKSVSFRSGDTINRIKIDDLLDFLRDKAAMLETLSTSHKPSQSLDRKPSSYPTKVHCNVMTEKAEGSTSTKDKSNYLSRKRSCWFCNGAHPLYSCQKFLDISLAEKQSFIKVKKLCENCLRLGHTAVECRYGPCRKCEKKHNSLICDSHVRSVALHSTTEQPQPPQSPPPSPPAPYNSSSQSYSIQLNSTHSDLSSSVLLSTAVVCIPDHSGKLHEARALLDSGSERSLVTKSLCDKLNAPLIQSTQQIRGVSSIATQCTQACEFEIRSRDGTFSSRINCLVLPKITSTLPSFTFSGKLFRVPDEITLADPNFFESRPVDMLIGADLFWELLTEGKMRLASGPFLKNTRLGWVVSGSVSNYNIKPKDIHCNFALTSTLQSIDKQLRLFWEVEELPVYSKSNVNSSSEESLCEAHFIDTTKRNADGRFCVKMPLKLSPDKLGDTYAQAERRFYALEKRLERNPDYKLMYADFIHEYVGLGHMTRVDSYSDAHYFLPHHGVFRAHATTTKLRVVFDASAESTTGVSLNDLQMIGPAVQGDLLAILLRFREFEFVACADIEKFYRQVLIDESQRDLLLILWRDSPSDPLDVYRLNTVTYGTASAPFLSCRCLKQLAQETSDPDVADIILNQFYVDDMSCNAPTKESLLKICDDTAKLLQTACLPLRKWVYNFENGSDNNSHAMFKNLSVGESVQSKTLGLGWYPQQDELYFHTELEQDVGCVSKRLILSCAAQIYDPLGLVSPAIIIAKILMQKCWSLQLHWDEPVPDDISAVWNKFVSGLESLKAIRVPRYVMTNKFGSATTTELHLFTDASQAAYGACAYIRVIDRSQGNAVVVSLLCAKGKVASLKPIMTIPRLELCGALLGARLFLKLDSSLRTQFASVVFWTDSTIVLGWLNTPLNKLKPFVQNRVSEILEITKGHEWRHVIGKENPADVVSRGCHFDSLSKSTLWWGGPEFLQNIEDKYSPVVYKLSSDLPELKPETSHNFTTQQDCGDSSLISVFPVHRFSQFVRMQRSLAYVLRFIRNGRTGVVQRKGMLNEDELNESVLILARLSQRESFGDLYDSFKAGSVNNVPAHLSKLNLFFDKETQLVRVGGRIGYSREFDYDKKHPILISCKHRFTELLFRYKHIQLMHAAPQLLLYSIRESWWPIGGRNFAGRTYRKCVICDRFRKKNIQPIMGNLPKERLESGFPFKYCGVDYAGPVLVLNRRGRGAKTTKAYICLFICFATRAIHLELVSDLSSNSYLLALKRFISRRGKPLEIFSDNGKNFVGLMNEFKTFLHNCSDDIKEYAVSQGITFRMNPPYASHFGGLWEAGVKSCKHHLRRVVGNAHLTFEEYSTVLAEIEAILNSRPLTPLSSDTRDLLPLSPGHFLVGRPLMAPVSADLSDVATSRLNRFQRLEQIRQHFWARWSKEYISQLQVRMKWTKGCEDLKEDTLVLLKEDNQPPLKWNLGRVAQVFPGKDGVARVADIRTANGIVRRAFSRICPLPLREPYESQQTNGSQVV